MEARKALAGAYIVNKDHRKAIRVLMQVRRIYRMRLRSNQHDVAARKGLSEALARSAMVRLSTISEGMDSREIGLDKVNEVLINLERTIRECKEAHSLDPDNPAVLVSNILSRWMKATVLDLVGIGGKYEAAMETANRLVREHPDLPTGYAHRALLHFTQGETVKASDDANRALQISPSAGLAMIVRGNILKQDRKWKGALKALGLGAQLEPSWRGFVAADIAECQERLK